MRHLTPCAATIRVAREFLPTKANKENGLLLSRAERGRKAVRRARAVTVVACAITLWQAPAFAVNEPRVVSTFPEANGAVQSRNATDLWAEFDRDLATPSSSFALADRNAHAVSGTTSLSDPHSGTPGHRRILFHPSASLDEALSPYTASIRACPPVAGGCTQVSVLFHVDDTDPAAPVVSDPINGATITDQVVDVRGDAEAGAWIWVIEGDDIIATGRADTGGTYALVLPYGHEDGITHSIDVHAVDRAGNVSPDARVSFLHDDVVVPPLITHPEEGARVNSSPVEIRGTAKPGSAVTVHEGNTTLGTHTAESDGTWHVTVSAAEGSHVVTATSFDGRETDGPSLSRTFIVDLTPPAAPVVSAPGEGDFVPTSDVPVAGTAEPGSTVRIRDETMLRATVATSGAGAWNTTISFTEGPHSLAVTATDVAGNIGPATTRTFTVDTIAPPVPTIDLPEDGAFLSSSSVMLTGHAEPGARVRIIEDRTVRVSTLTDGSGAWSATAPFNDGAHNVTAVALDAAGNSSDPSLRRTFTVDTTIPSPPLIHSPAPGATLESAHVEIAGNAEPGATVVAREGLAVIGQAYADGNGAWTISADFTDGPHSIAATAQDAAGNTSAPSAARAFTVEVPQDSDRPDPPEILAPAPGSVQPGFVTFRGTAEPGTTVRVYEGFTLVGTSAADGNGTWRFGQAMVQGNHVIHATATDKAGNLSDAGPPQGFMVDTTRPTVSIDSVDPIVSLPLTDAAIEGTADDNLAVGHIDLEIDDWITGVRVRTVTADSCDGCPSTGVHWSAHVQLPAGLYTVSAYAVDLAGNRSAADSAMLIRA